MSEERVVHQCRDFFAGRVSSWGPWFAISIALRPIKLADDCAHIFYLESFKNLGLLPQLMLKQRVSIDARTSGRQERPRDT
ncbi:hypothetical protein, partial [Rhizobium sp. 12,4]|uniref:hypothetical protein n=1 Tax=Rhizobium sp. 12,4 TaxID=3405135 RepID=UPI003D333EAD